MRTSEAYLTWLKNYPGLLDTCKCFSLIQEIEQHVIINKEPFFHLHEDEITCGELSYFLEISPDIPMNKKLDLYFHLGDAKSIDFKIDRKRKHKKLTLDDKIHKDVVLTLVY